MSSLRLVHPEEELTIPISKALSKCLLFQNTPSLSSSPYRLKSPISLSIFREFVSAIEGHPFTITLTNFSELQLLSSEFGFTELTAKISEFRLFEGISELRNFIATKFELFEGEFSKLRSTIAGIQIQHSPLKTQISPNLSDSKDFSGLQTEISTLKTQFTQKLNDPIVQELSINFIELQKEISALKAQLTQKLNDPIVQKLSTELSEMQKEISTLKAQFTQKLNDPVFHTLSTDCIELQKEFSALKTQIKPILNDSVSMEFRALHTKVFSLIARLTTEFRTENCILWNFSMFSHLRSHIISSFPDIFSEFQRKQFKLFWRGSRHTFLAQAFHNNCDGHRRTLTLILDTNGNIFGGFTPVEWEARVWNERNGDESNTFKADHSLKSFLFTLKNPHNLGERKFMLKAEARNKAIICGSKRGPDFWDLAICDSCDSRRNSFGDLGKNYENNTRLDGQELFTQEMNFQVQEIEVFEITD
jgi:uncharacterized small protein (DUF1192 family)